MSRPQKQRMSKLTRTRIKAAYEYAATLGELKPVKPAARRADGSPLLAPGQVYVTKTGTKYHPEWCPMVAAKWDHDSRLMVTLLVDVGLRTPCDSCATPLTSSVI